MSEKQRPSPYNIRDFVRISSSSIKKLQGVRGQSKYSRVRLKNLQSKVKDLKSVALKQKDRQELMFEISREIGLSENSSEVVRPDYVSYFSTYVSDYRKNYPELFSSQNAHTGLLEDYRSTFDFIRKLETNDLSLMWEVFNRITKRESNLMVYAVGNGVPPGRFYDSFSGWMKLDHKNILSLRELFPYGQSLGVETELVGNRDLTSISKPLKTEEALHIAYQVAEAVEHAHSKGTVHLFLSPQELLISQKSGTLKVSGWNLSRLFADDRGTVARHGISTSFCAPEVLKSDANSPSHSADVYSISLILAWLVSRENDPSMIEAGKLQLDNVELLSLIQNGLDPHPAERMNASQFRIGLGRLLGLPEKSSGNHDTGAIESESRINILSEGTEVANVASGEGKVTRIEINLTEGSKKHEDAGEESVAKQEKLTRLAKQLSKLLDSGRYDSLLQTIRKKESEIAEVYPELKESLAVTISNLSAVVKFPTVPREEVDNRIHDLMAALDPEQ